MGCQRCFWVTQSLRRAGLGGTGCDGETLDLVLRVISCAGAETEEDKLGEEEVKEKHGSNKSVENCLFNKHFEKPI